jgi:hypothetical protein
MVLVSYKPYSILRTINTNDSAFEPAVIRRLFHARRRDILAKRGERMITVEFITALFYEVDE